MLKHICAFVISAFIVGCTKIPTTATVDEQPKPTLNAKQVYCLAKNIYFEARGESVDGHVAVAQVTLNRVKSGQFPNSVCGVVYQAEIVDGLPIIDRCQFSWYCDGKPDHVRYSSAAWSRAVKIAELTLQQEYPNIVGNSLYYHADYVYPRWAVRKKIVTKIGRHIFYL